MTWPAPLVDDAFSAGRRPFDDAPSGGVASDEDPPPDAADRARVATSLDETVFAVAGAGSGKTKHLVDRVVRLLVSGKATVDQLAVITFTEAAAAELRDRVAEELEQAAGRDGSPTAALAALDGLDAAAITTLHGFARRILVDHAVDAGVPPTFEVLDEARAVADLYDRWPGILEDLLSGAHVASAVQRVLVAGASLRGLRPILRQLTDHWDRLLARPRIDPASITLPAVDAEAVLDPLRRAVALAGACTVEDDALVVHLGRVSAFADQIDARAGEELELLRLLATTPRLTAGNRGRRSAWSGRKDDVHALLRQAEAARAGVLDGCGGSALRVLVAALADRAVAEARRRQAEGRLQYHDLLTLACEVVRSRPAVRSALHHRYRYLLVDEFQDTDPLQAELVAMIAADPAADVEGTEWWRLPVVPGALFFVGDPLQSIYSFRGADIATFSLTWRTLGTSTASLVANFRSVPGIVEWVNATFGALVGDGVADVQPAFRAAVAQRARHSSRPPVTVVGAGAPHDERAPDARRREAAEAAALLRRAVDEGWPVGPDGRAATVSDLAVLVSTRAAVPALEEALDAAGLDYRLESSSLLYGAPEVEELFAVLRAVDDPSDALAVVAALRTPGFACGDDDLLRFRQAGGTWDYRVEGAGGTWDHRVEGAGGGEAGKGGEGGPVRRAMAALRALHEARSFTGVSEMVWQVVTERRQLEAALDGPRWREEWRRLRYVADQARQFCERSPGGLRQYLAWVEAQREEDARVTEVVLPEVDAPAVTVMTAHAAKGLEFPVVAVIGFGGDRKAVAAPAVLFGPDGPELSLSTLVRTSGFEACRRDDELVQQHELVRLLYVAVTRARDHLVVSVHRWSRAQGTPAGALEEALGAAEGLWLTPEDQIGATNQTGVVGPEDQMGSLHHGGPPVQGALFDELPAPAGAPESAPAPARRSEASDAGSAEALDQWARERAARLARAPRVIAATSVATMAAGVAAAAVTPAGDAGETAGEDAAEEPPRAPWRRGRGGTAVGRAVHAVLQTVDLATGEGLEAFARTHAGLEGVPGRVAEIEALARAALASDRVRAAARSRHWRELYVGAPVGDHVLEGFVDLLFEGGDGLEVVDFKTDAAAGDADLDRLVARYRLQAAAYARAVQATTGRPVRTCTLLFLRGGAAVERPIETLRGAIDQVDAVLSAGSPAADPSP